MCVLVTQSCLTLCDPWTLACQAPQSMGFFRQENWSGFPSPGDLPKQGIKPDLLPCRQILDHLSYQGSYQEVVMPVTTSILHPEVS